RCRLRHLFRGGMAQWRAESAAIQPDARGDLQRADHGIRFRNAVAVEPSRNRQHGRAFDDLARLDLGDDAVLPARAAGTAAEITTGYFFICSSVRSLIFLISAGAPLEAVDAKSERRVASWLIVPFR